MLPWFTDHQFSQKLMLNDPLFIWMKSHKVRCPEMCTNGSCWHKQVQKHDPNENREGFYF
ncbi:MAG: hypothetical protein ACI81W_000452 [Saprospiraceae bacterium]|jgi:hypothetical protein